MSRPPRSIRDPRLDEQRRREKELAEQRAEAERLAEVQRLEEIRREEEYAARRREDERLAEERRSQAAEAKRRQQDEQNARIARPQSRATPQTPVVQNHPPEAEADGNAVRQPRAEAAPPVIGRLPQASGGGLAAGVKPRIPAGRGKQRRKSTPIVPPSNVQSRALMAVIAIMAFLACLTLGGVSMVRATAASWQGGISREITIQIKPQEGRDMNAALLDARDIALQFVGTLDGRIVDEAATERLLEPWLGTGLDFDELPVPRLVIVTIDENNPPDFKTMNETLQKAIPGAYLDDHRAWVNRLSAMADATTSIGAAIMALVFFAMVLTVVFATRGALAGSRAIVEVLHFVGAEGAFVARQFQRHFLNVALKGAFLGGCLACLFFVVMRVWQRQFLATPGADQATALFGTITIGWGAFAGIFITVILIAFLTTLTARFTVIRTIREIDRLRSDPEHSNGI